MIKQIAAAVCVFTLLALCTQVLLLLPAAQAAGRDRSVIMFTAKWCANCRDITPVVRDIAFENGYPMVVEVDVDQADAPKKAGNYGLSIPNSELPQIYRVSQGNVKLILTGNQYQYGETDALKTLLRQGLPPQ